MTEQTLHSDAVNVKNLTASYDQIVAIGASDLCATAKYVATLMIATGLKSATELIAVSGLKRTTIYRSIAEIFDSPIAEFLSANPMRPTSPTNPTDGIPTSPTDGNASENSVPPVPPVGHEDPEPSCALDITTRATNELPSEVVILENITPLLRRPPSQKKSTGTRGSRLANDWQLPEDWRQWTLVNCPCSTPEAVNREALIFANYWQALAGQKATKVDWRKTWQNWTLKAFATAPIRERRAPAPFVNPKLAANQAFMERINAKLAEFAQ